MKVFYIIFKSFYLIDNYNKFISEIYTNKINNKFQLYIECV